MRTFIATAAVVLALLVPFVVLFDTDSHFHLAAAHRYLEGHLRGGLEWARISAMAQGFGDKELLFHVLLMPFVAVSRSTLAGKLALAVLNGAIAVVLARLFAPLLGRGSCFVHAGLALTAIDYSGRLLRLRPELVSLPILLLALLAAAHERHRALGVIAFVYALSYSGFHVLPLLCLLWFAREVAARRRPWPLVVWPALGTLLGVALHPQFPANVRIWLLQSVLRYFVPLPDAGPEMVTGASLGLALRANAGWLLGLLVLWRSGHADERAREDDGGRLRAYAVVATVLFAALFLALPTRFGLYLVPLATLGLLLEMRRRGRRVSGRVRLARGRSVPLAAGLAVALALGAFSVRSLVQAMAASACFSPDWERNAKELGKTMPVGARVAAGWAEAESYTFWAPQGRYLNLLDPVFMAVPYPEAYRASLSVFEGRQPDVPLVVGTTLGSDYLAFPPTRRPELLARVTGDPRLRPLHAAGDVLVALVPGANRSFLVDWRVAPEGTPATAALGSGRQDWPPYPRFGSERGEALEGFVDQSRLGPLRGCRAFARSLIVPAPVEVTWELSPWGPASLWVDGRLELSLLSGTRAVLGQGALVSRRLLPGGHLLAVESCPADGIGGFYLVERQSVPSPDYS